MVVVDFNGGAFAWIDDRFGQVANVYAELLVFETAAVEGGLAALGVAVFTDFALFVAGERGGRA